MLDRFEPVLKMVCLALAALLFCDVIRLVVHSDPLGHSSIPPLPTLAVQPGTNTLAKQKLAATNAPAKDAKGQKGTNALAQIKPGRRRGPGGPSGALKLPPPIQARVDRIQESEILGPFIRPMPMALLGIADDDAFLRAPNGQTGMVKEGDELGGVKLLRIGINRVLVEQDGKQQELTLFSGFGGESFLPKETTDASNAVNTPNQEENP